MFGRNLGKGFFSIKTKNKNILKNLLLATLYMLPHKLYIF